MYSAEHVLKNGEIIKVCSLDKSHIPYVWAIEKESFTEPWSMRSFEEIFDTEFTLSLGAFDGTENIIGYIIADFVIDTGEILNIAVDNAFKNQGVGGILLDAVHKTLECACACQCFLEVRESNEPAKALYAKKGYLPVGLRKNYYKNPKENAIILRKNFE